MYTYKHTRNLPWYVRETLWLFKIFKSLYTKYMGASQCLYIHTRAHTLNAFYTYTHAHTHIGMRRTRDNLLLVHGRTYTNARVAWLTHAGAANRLSVYPSQGCMGNQALVQTSVLATYKFAYACVPWHAYTCQTFVVGIVKQLAFKLSPSNSQNEEPQAACFACIDICKRFSKHRNTVVKPLVVHA
jgi:hypothetical protein